MTNIIWSRWISNGVVCGVGCNYLTSKPVFMYYATNRKVAGSIPDGVIGNFSLTKSFRSHYGPGVESASNRDEYQEHFLGVKATGA